VEAVLKGSYSQVIKDGHPLGLVKEAYLTFCGWSKVGSKEKKSENLPVMNQVLLAIWG
jgi:hypothetical protein